RDHPVRAVPVITIRGAGSLAGAAWSRVVPYIITNPPPGSRAPFMVDPDFLAHHLDVVLEDATIPELPNHYRGKVRDNYDLPDGPRLIIATDRLSAFDRNIAAILFT